MHPTTSFVPWRHAAAALAAAVGVGLTTTARAQDVAWAWVAPAGQPATFTPSASYQYTPSGAPVTVARDPVQNNRFVVTMPGVGAGTGVVHACAYGGNHIAVVNSWGSSGTAVLANVELFTPSGAAANDAAFTIHYRLEGPNARREAYLWADQPASASYTPSTTYSWNGNRADPTITRSGTGTYSVRLPGLATTGAEGGHVQVTAYNSVLQRAKVTGWGSSGADMLIGVRTFDAAGAPADGRFVLSYNESAAPIAAAEGSGAHVWASNPTAASYAVTGFYTDSNGKLGPAEAENVTRLGTGTYRVELPNVAPFGSSIAQVTAYGSGSQHASISNWSTNGCGGTFVTVRTYDPSGAAVDTLFDLLYLTNRPAAKPEVAWAWVPPPSGTASPFTPPSNYQHTSSGAPITVARDPVQGNRFVVTFPGVGSDSGVVHACAYGGNHLAVVNSWGGNGTDVTAAIELFTPAGGAANNAPFTVLYRRGGGNDDRSAQLWADQPGSASYTPSTYYAWNADRGAPTITRSSAGSYTVRLPGLGTPLGSEFGHVQVTPYSGSLARAKVSSWGGSAGDLLISVRTFDAAGAAADGFFVLSYNESAAPIDPAEGSGAHVWANDPSSASYTPSSGYTDSNGTFGPLNSETIDRVGTGVYRVNLPNVAPSNSSFARATAYGGGSQYASIAFWGGNGAGGTSVQVNTYTAAGVPADTLFTLLYLTDRSGVEDPGANHRFVGSGCHGMTMSASPDPLSTPTTGSTVSYFVHNAPPAATGLTASLGLVVLTLNGNPAGLSLAPFGASGCFSYVNSLDVTIAFTGPITSSQSVAFAIPAGVPCGLLLYAQAAALTSLNAFGIATSNGIESRIEDF
jgi:hypothetical protein